MLRRVHAVSPWRKGDLDAPSFVSATTCPLLAAPADRLRPRVAKHGGQPAGALHFGQPRSADRHVDAAVAAHRRHHAGGRWARGGATQCARYRWHFRKSLPTSSSSGKPRRAATTPIARRRPRSPTRPRSPRCNAICSIVITGCRYLPRCIKVRRYSTALHRHNSRACAMGGRRRHRRSLLRVARRQRRPMHSVARKAPFRCNASASPTSPGTRTCKPSCNRIACRWRPAAPASARLPCPTVTTIPRCTSTPAMPRSPAPVPTSTCGRQPCAVATSNRPSVKCGSSVRATPSKHKPWKWVGKRSQPQAGAIFRSYSSTPPRTAMPIPAATIWIAPISCRPVTGKS